MCMVAVGCAQACAVYICGVLYLLCLSSMSFSSALNAGVLGVMELIRSSSSSSGHHMSHLR